MTGEDREWHARQFAVDRAQVRLVAAEAEVDEAHAAHDAALLALAEYEAEAL